MILNKEDALNYLQKNEYECVDDQYAYMMAFDALRLQIPKKVIDDKKKRLAYCPSCKKRIRRTVKYNYCVFCGQKLDWN